MGDVVWVHPRNAVDAAAPCLVRKRRGYFLGAGFRVYGASAQGLGLPQPDAVVVGLEYLDVDPAPHSVVKLESWVPWPWLQMADSRRPAAQRDGADAVPVPVPERPVSEPGQAKLA